MANVGKEEGEDSLHGPLCTEEGFSESPPLPSSFVVLVAVRILVASLIVRRDRSKRDSCHASSAAAAAAAGMPNLFAKKKASARRSCDRKLEENKEVHEEPLENGTQAHQEEEEKRAAMRLNHPTRRLSKSNQKIEAVRKKQHELCAGYPTLEEEESVVLDNPTAGSSTQSFPITRKTKRGNSRILPEVTLENVGQLDSDWELLRRSELAPSWPCDSALSDLDHDNDIEGEISSLPQIIAFDDEFHDVHGNESLQAKSGRPLSKVYKEEPPPETSVTQRQLPDSNVLHFGNPILWPFGLAVKAVGFQVWLAVQTFLLAASIFSWCNSFAMNRVRDTLQVKDKATEAMSLMSNVPPKVKESGSIVLKRAAWGCLAATYVIILLSMLLFPALVLDYIFLARVVEEPLSMKRPLHLDYTESYPSSVVPVLVGGMNHRVQITVILTLPESDYNLNLGMFQLTAELMTNDGEIIMSSSRPCMLRFYSAPIRLAKTFLVSLPLLVGMLSESQTLTVPLMDFEQQSEPTCCVKILLQPKAGMPPGQGLPELYFAEIQINSQLPWMKNIVHKWKWTFYIWTGILMYIFEVILVLCCCRGVLVPTTWVGRSGQNPFEASHVVGRSGQNPFETSTQEPLTWKGSVNATSSVNNVLKGRVHS